jgi:hypothetical protein
MEDQNSGNVTATGNSKNGGFFRQQWVIITGTALIALIVGLLIGHCCHRRHCCGDRCEMGRGMMMHRGWGGGMGGHFGRGGMGWGGMREEGMRGMDRGDMHGGPMGMHGDFDPKAMVDHMKGELGLSDQQVQQITALMEQQKAKMEAAMKSDSGRGQDWRASRDQLHAQIKAVLTPDQQAKFQQMMDGMGRGE